MGCSFNLTCVTARVVNVNKKRLRSVTPVLLSWDRLLLTCTYASVYMYVFLPPNLKQSIHNTLLVQVFQSDSNTREVRSIPTCTCTSAQFEGSTPVDGPFVGSDIEAHMDVTFHHAAVVAFGGGEILCRDTSRLYPTRSGGRSP